MSAPASVSCGTTGAMARSKRRRGERGLTVALAVSAVLHAAAFLFIRLPDDPIALPRLAEPIAVYFQVIGPPARAAESKTETRTPLPENALAKFPAAVDEEGGGAKLVEQSGLAKSGAESADEAEREIVKEAASWEADSDLVERASAADARMAAVGNERYVPRIAPVAQPSHGLDDGAFPFGTDPNASIKATVGTGGDRRQTAALEKTSPASVPSEVRTSSAEAEAEGRALQCLKDRQALRESMGGSYYPPVQRRITTAMSVDFSLDAGGDITRWRIVEGPSGRFGEAAKSLVRDSAQCILNAGAADRREGATLKNIPIVFEPD